MAWVAINRTIRIIEEFTEPHDNSRQFLPRYRSLRDRIHRDVSASTASTSARTHFTQAYDRPALDAGVLLMPALGFLPASNARRERFGPSRRTSCRTDSFCGTSRSTRAMACGRGFRGCVSRLPFWLVDAYAYSDAQGRRGYSSGSSRCETTLVFCLRSTSRHRVDRKLPASLLASRARALGERPFERRSEPTRKGERRNAAAGSCASDMALGCSFRLPLPRGWRLPSPRRSAAPSALLAGLLSPRRSAAPFEDGKFSAFMCLPTNLVFRGRMAFLVPFAAGPGCLATPSPSGGDAPSCREAALSTSSSRRRHAARVLHQQHHGLCGNRRNTPRVRRRRPAVLEEPGGAGISAADFQMMAGWGATVIR